MIALLSLAAAACSNDTDVQALQTVTIVPDLTGYNTIALGGAGASARRAPVGTFSYLVVDGAIDWYVFATHLAPARAYRILLTTDDGKEYAVASRRSRGDGSLGVHGVETALKNRQCVGAEDPARRPLASAKSLHIVIKTDGSASGATGNDVVGSRSSLPCGGNGDGVFDYVMWSRDSVSLTP